MSSKFGGDLRRELKVCRNLRHELEGALRHVLSLEDEFRREPRGDLRLSSNILKVS